MDWNALEFEIYKAARDAFDDLRKAHPDEEFYAYALYTDGDAMTVLASANSLRGFAKAVSQQSDTSAATLAYYKWATSEWACEGWKSSYFKEIFRAAQGFGEASKSRNVQALCRSVHDGRPKEVRL
jgi:hypothetical protein